MSIRRLWTDERGAATTELVLAVPLLLVLLLLIAQFTLWLHATHVAQAAASEALSVTRVDGGTVTEGQAEANRVLHQLGSGPLDSPHATVNRGATEASVRVEGTVTAVVPFLTLTARDRGVSLDAIGVRAQFRYETSWPAYSRALADGRYPIFLYAWYADVPDPDNFLSQLFHSRSPRNLFGYRNPAVDDALGRARLASDPQQRAELYRQAEQLVLADAPIIPMWHYTYERLFQPYVRSIEVNGLGDPYIPLRKVWLDRP